MPMRLLVAFLAVVAAPRPTLAAESGTFARTLTFERDHDGDLPRGWRGGPAQTIAIDDDVVHAGTWAVRFERDASSPRNSSTLAASRTIDFSGNALLLTGWIRTEDVTGGALLWMRQEADGESVSFQNTRRRTVSGTQDWQRLTIRLPIEASADTVVFGGTLFGTGTAWFDDFTLTVDGLSLEEAPPREVTALETDTDFVDGSRIDTDDLTTQQIDRLVLLGEVWGFVKYHHPDVTSGRWHWDFELFRIVPEVLAASDTPSFRRVMLAWLDRIGRPVPCDPCADPVPDDLQFAPDLDWIRDTTRLGGDLSSRLVEIHARRPATPASIFVDTVPFVGNPVFRNEPAYADVPLPDPGYQLLALFRTWNVARWWFPYRNLIDQDWRAVLAEFVPRLMAADNADTYALELMAFITRFDDGHAALWSATHLRPPRGSCRFPVAVDFVEGRPVVVDLLAPDLTDLRIGDVLVAFEGEPVEELLEEWAPYHSASNESALHRSLAAAMTRGACGPAGVTVDRAGGRQQIVTPRVATRGLDTSATRSSTRAGAAFQRLSEDIAYLRIDGVESDDVASYVEKIDGTRGLVIDLRGYPNGFLVFALGQHLVGENTPFVRFTRGDLVNPGAFRWTEPLELSPAGEAYDGRLVVLVDHHALSSSEYHAMAFRAVPGAVVVGSTTAGADGNVSPFTLPGGHRSQVSGVGIFYPDRTPTQRVGIVPDVEIRPTIEGIRQGRDEVLEEALRRILGPAADEDTVRALAARG